MCIPSGGALRERVVPLATALTLAVLLLSGGCDRSNAAAPPAMPPPAVTVCHPVRREVTDFDEYTGRLEAAQAVDVRARVSGFIDAADFQEGSIVQAGALLFVIDPRPFQAEVDRAQAEAARAQAQVQQTTEELARLEKIRSGAATERELLNARYNKAAADAALAAAQAAVKSATLNLGFTRVTAPIAGRVGRRLMTPGNLVIGGSSAEGTLLTTISQIDPIDCYVNADERAVLRYQRMARENRRQSARDGRVTVQLALTDEAGFPHEGHIDFINNRLDPATGTLQIRATFRNPDGFFTPGLFARLRVPGSAPYQATLVADEAIGADQAQRFVLVVDHENTVQYRPVTPGPLFEGLRVVQGVGPDEWVVVNGLQRARPGMKVDPKQQPMPVRARQAGSTQPAPTQPAEGGRGQ